MVEQNSTPASKAAPSTRSSRCVVEEIILAVPPETVYAAVSDPTHTGRWSPECTGAKVGRSGPLTVGDRFVGHNRRGWARWSTVCTVTEAEPGRMFAFDVAVPGLALARWSWELEPAEGGGTLVRHGWEDHRTGLRGLVLSNSIGALLRTRDRAAVNSRNMRTTLMRLKQDLESGA